MEDLFIKLVPKVSAQSFDALAQPTFGSIDIGGGSSITGSVLLSSDKTSVTVGERFKVRVELKTNDVNISEYRVVVDFDPTKLTVIDADPSVNGTQVRVLDEVFTVPNPLDDNTVASVGRIRVRASAPSTPLTVNKDVVEIEFQAQSAGSTGIKVVEGSVGSQIVREAGVGLSYTANEVTIDVTTQTSTTTTGSTTGTTTTGSTAGTTGTTTTTGGQQIPDTALSDDVISAASVIFGVLFVILGSSLVINKSKNNRQKQT